MSFAGGFAHLQKGHGVAFGDLDGDGDQDLFHQLGGFYPADDYANILKAMERLEEPCQSGCRPSRLVKALPQCCQDQGRIEQTRGDAGGQQFG